MRGRIAPVEDRAYYVYILAGKSAVLYTGVTRNLLQRLAKHRERSVPGFTARYNLTRLVHYEIFGSAGAAIAREKQIKGWLRAKKIALIESKNPEWKDLSGELM